LRPHRNRPHLRRPQPAHRFRQSASVVAMIAVASAWRSMETLRPRLQISAALAPPARHGGHAMWRGFASVQVPRNPWTPRARRVQRALLHPQSQRQRSRPRPRLVLRQAPPPRTVTFALQRGPHAHLRPAQASRAGLRRTYSTRCSPTFVMQIATGAIC
jgi:hypothetical protein